MAPAEDHVRRWEPFGVTEADFAAVPERNGVRVVNVTPGAGRDKGQARRWLQVAMAALGALAAAAAAVSWQAQYTMVHQVKQQQWVAAVEAGIPDAGAVVFAALGIALALHGKRALRPRALNVACVGISLLQNALASPPQWKDMAIWVMPSAVYALASDTLIGVVRAWTLARARNLGEALADDGPTPLAMVAGVALWLLRLALAPRSTLAGFRSWVVTDCPVAPGLRPGHVAQLNAVHHDADQRVALAAAELEAVRQEAAQRVALAEAGRDEEAREAREETAQARAAEAAIRDELDRTRSGMAQVIDQALAGAARDRDEARAQARLQGDGLRAELAQVREDAARLAATVRDASDARLHALEAARGELLDVSDQAAGALRAAAAQPRGQRARTQRDPGEIGPTKRDRMVELAGHRRDLASLPLGEVSALANELAAEIGYSASTARRELLRHVRQLQAAVPPPADGQPAERGAAAAASR